tara:strand:- start:866 stop:1243 length:378 start_codon:yes stop_codon:yes gene_type:complete
MTVKVYSSGEHIQKMNGVNIKDQTYQLEVNPNNKNKVHVSVTNDGLTIKKEYDSLENFFNQINNSEEGLLTNLQNDLKKFEHMPEVIHKEKMTIKRKKYKKQNPKLASRKKLRKPRSVKKFIPKS